MRLLTTLVLTAAAITAQSPLSTTFADNNGGAVGGAVYFELECLDPAGLTITDLDLNFSGAGGVAGSIDVYIVSNTWAPHTQSGWVPFTSGTVAASQAAGTPTNVVLNTPLSLGAGCKIGVAIVHNGLGARYTTATTLPSTYQTAELQLTVGGGSNTPFGGSAFTPRLVNTNINYTAGGSCPTISSPASVESEGSGCGGSTLATASFYEVAAAGTLDLSGMILTGVRTGLSSYQMAVSTGTGFGVPLGSTDLNAGDDVVIDTAGFGGTLGMFVSSNGSMASGPGNNNGWAPNITTFLNNPSEGIYSWTDLQPNAATSGHIYYDEPAAGVARVTFDGVFGWGTMDPNDIQMTMDTNTGDFSIEWGATGATNPNDTLVGRSTAGASADPGAIDISATQGLDGFYEIFAAGTGSDLVGMKVTGTSNGNGYDITVAAGTGFGVGLGTSILALGDDDQIQVGTLGLTVASNCWMATGPGNSNGWSPTVPAFLTNPSTGVYCWTDLNPTAAGSGNIYYGESGTVGTATYNDVYGWGTSAPNKVKLTYDVSNGDFSIEIATISNTNPEPLLVGYKDGNAVMDQPIDISAAAPLSIVPPFTRPLADVLTLDLALSSASMPIQGAAAVAFDVTTDNMPASMLSHVGLLGLSNPNVDLTGLGLTGCFQLASGDVLDFVVLPSGTTSHTWTALTIPAGPVFFNGFEFHVQSAIFGTNLNSFVGLGALTSNGLKCTIGDV